MTRLRRLRIVSVAALCGWLTGLVTTSPLQVAQVTRNADGWLQGLQLFAIGMGIWAAWTLLLASVGWCLAGLPVAALVSPNLLTRHSRFVITMSGLIAAGVVAVQFRVWHIEWTNSDLLAIRLYSLFLVSFAVSTAWFYLRFLRRQSSLPA